MIKRSDDAARLPTLPLFTAAGTRDLDRTAIEAHGIPGYRLMTRAGRVLFRCLHTRWPGARRITVLCGAGNNAGDGYVVARLAREAGLEVTLRHVIPPDKLAGDAARACEDWHAAGGESRAFDGTLAPADVVVDALLGTGLDRPLEGTLAQAVEVANAAPVPALAVDVPTGLQADTGAILGTAIRAELTPTFIGRKQGLFTGSGPACAGEVVFDDLDVPGATFDAVEAASGLVQMADLRSLLPLRSRDTHKGSFGFVTVLGGDRGMPGAVALASLAALRTGAGMVKAGTHPEHAATIPLGHPAVMADALDDAGAVGALRRWAHVVAVGPGLGRSDWSRTVFEAALDHEGPLVIDADGLNLLADSGRRADHWILTPHPGEAARLLGTDTGAIQADRFAAARAIQARYGGVCVLKGSGTLVADGERTWVASDGNPGMATAGMGDVLTGVTAALLAQGFALATAGVLGVCAHAAAADHAARDGERGLLATDVIDALRAVVNPTRR